MRHETKVVTFFLQVQLNMLFYTLWRRFKTIPHFPFPPALCGLGGGAVSGPKLLKGGFADDG